jgi:hypothetical protein
MRDEDAPELQEPKIHWHLIRGDLQARAAAESGN